MTGDMFLIHVRKTARAENKKLANAVAKLIAEERARHRAEIEALRSEIAELKKQMPLRAISSKDAA